MSLKTLIGTAIISLGIAGLIFVIQNSAPSLNQTAKIKSEKNNNLVSDKPFIETINNTNSSNLPNNRPSENLTEIFTKGIGKTIAQNNLPGPQDFNGQKVINAPDADAVANNLIQEAAQKFNPSILRPAIKDSYLKISQDNSKEALNSYILAFQKILKESSKQIPLIKTEEDVLKNISEIINIYSDTIKEFYKLSVPPQALAIHKKQLELLTAKRNILEKIKDYQTDPVTAIFASQALEGVENDFLKLSKDFSNFIKSNI